MIINETLFEILIYSCDQDQFLAHITRHVDDVMSEVHNYGNGHWEQQRAAEISRRIYPVRYNELIGAIEVHSVGTQLRADYWFIDEKVVIRSKAKRIIRYKGSLLEKSYECSQLHSPQIFASFRSALVEVISHNKHLRTRCIDLSTFDRCGPFIDWRAVVNI